ncbi:MAG: methyltransferase domain-containing protein [Thermoanaerobaculia bacterium]|nr:methyltransferase domain-containing protein [Thermoanaerobaculia bacterium]
MRRLFEEPLLQGVDVDSDHLVEVHRRILERKPMLRRVFREIYELCRSADDRYFDGLGRRIELGSGSSLFKTYYPDVETSDLKTAPHLDLTLDAQALDLEDRTVRALYGIHCFHHFPDPRRFFRELQRVLIPGGGCVLIEPYHGPLANWFFRRMFDLEHYDPLAISWESSNRDVGYMSHANQALSYIVFTRDRSIFLREFPELETSSRNDSETSRAISCRAASTSSGWFPIPSLQSFAESRSCLHLSIAFWRFTT